MKLPDWLKLLKGDMDTDDDGDVCMLLHEPIGNDGFGGISSKQFGEALNSIPRRKKVTLDINSLGGRIDDGIAMCNMLVARGNVHTRVSGFAASMGAIIHQGGAHRSMMPGTMLIIHNPQTSAYGEQSDVQWAADMLGKQKESLVGILAARTKNSKKKISDMMDAVTSFSPKEAQDAGFCDEVIDGSPAWNDFNPKRVVETCRQLYGAMSPAVVRGEPASTPTKGKPMHIALINALAGLAVISADATDEAAALTVKKAVDGVVADRDRLKTENDNHRAAMKLRVTNRVQAAIDTKKIKPERKDSLIAVGMISETDLDFLDDIVVAETNPRRSGAAPLPAEGHDDALTQMQNLRAQMKDASPTQAAVIAKQLRDLRGHKDLFATENNHK